MATFEKSLKVIEKPKLLTRSIILGEGDDVPPVFVGKGQTNYVCGNCDVILADHVWQTSISNIVVKCPCCNAHNEFPPLPGKSPKKTEFLKGNYVTSDYLQVKRGIRFEGL